MKQMHIQCFCSVSPFDLEATPDAVLLDFQKVDPLAGQIGGQIGWGMHCLVQFKGERRIRNDKNERFANRDY